MSRLRRSRRTCLSLTLAGCLAGVPVCFAGEGAATGEPPERGPAQDAGTPAELILVVGTSGAPEYDEAFRGQAERWRLAAERGGATCTTIGLEPSATGADGEDGDRERLRATIERAAVDGEGSERPLWLVYVGHGTFDGERAKLNLRGPDVSDLDLEAWLAPVTGPLALVLCAAATGPFLPRLSRPGRIVLTATRSGNEYSYSHLGEHLSLALVDPTADLDKDGSVSLLEAWVRGARRVEEFYGGEGRLVSEHSLLDDDGDGKGTPASWFRGVYARRSAAGGIRVDGDRARHWHLVPSVRERSLDEGARARRDELERALAALRARAADMSAEQYEAALEGVLVPLARLYRERAAGVEGR